MKHSELRHQPRHVNPRIQVTTKKGRFTTSQFIVKKDMPKEKIKRNHVIQIFRKRISEY